MVNLIEYVKMIKQGIKDPQAVLNGWINDAKFNRGDLEEDEMEEIIRRRSICETCPFMSRNAIEQGNYLSQRNDEHCIHCSCPITKKTASLESRCGIEIYNSINKKNPMELKWGVYLKPQKDDGHSETV